MERLAKHPEVGGYGEVLLPGVEGWSNWPRGAADRPFFTTYLKEHGVDSSIEPHIRLFQYLDYLYEPRRGFRAIGFKLMYGHIARYPQVLAYLRLRNVRVLHLFRTNLLDLFLSRQAVRARRWEHARSPAERECIRVYVDTNRLLSELSRIQLEQRIAHGVLRALQVEVYELTYEELLADDAGLYGALAFLGVSSSPGMDLAPVMLKLAPMSHRKGIANYHEVAATLRPTRFAGFLRD